MGYSTIVLSGRQPATFSLRADARWIDAVIVSQADVAGGSKAKKGVTSCSKVPSPPAPPAFTMKGKVPGDLITDLQVRVRLCPCIHPSVHPSVRAQKSDGTAPSYSLSVLHEHAAGCSTDSVRADTTRPDAP